MGFNSAFKGLRLSRMRRGDVQSTLEVTNISCGVEFFWGAVA